MNELIIRWQSPDLAAFHQQLKKSLVEGTFQGEISPFSQIGGLWDFRGYDFYQHRFIEDCSFIDVNLSYTNLTHCRFERSKFINTVFEKSTFDDFTEHGCVFNNCKFINTSIHNSRLGYDGTKYISCVYEKCQFRRTSYMRAEFTLCKFHNNNLNGTRFGSSSFEDCVFTGKVKNVWFRGGYIDSDDELTFGKAKPNPMTVSFEDAELLEITYTKDCDLSKVILPKKGKYIKFDRWKERLDHVASKLATWKDSKECKEILSIVNAYRPHAEDQEWMILNKDDMVKKMGENSAKIFFDLLSEI